MRRILMTKKLLVIIIICILSVYSFEPVYSLDYSHTFPRLANYFLSWNIDKSQADEIAKWDLVVLDMELQIKYPELLQYIKRKNPDIIMLAYITPQEIFDTPIRQYSELRKELAAGIHREWYMYSSAGDMVHVWPNTKMLNITSKCPVIEGNNFTDYLSSFIVDKILSSGYWDGIFYDNAWDNLSYFVGTNIDLNRDGQADNDIDTVWRTGMKELYEKTRQKSMNKNLIVVGNAPTISYKDVLNGNMIESFTIQDWSDRMHIYAYNNDNATPKPRINIINTNIDNKVHTTDIFNPYPDFKLMRYGLTSTLLENGYYSFDYGNTDHGQLWWYDEYGINLGEALSSSESTQGFKNYAPDVWRRDFENGLSLINSDDSSRTVELGGEYEKIHGSQDSTTNDGSIVSRVTIPSKDGLVLLKTFENLYDVLFRNGAFARFFRPDGSRVRNGFFVFEDEYKGGYQIAHMDMDHNGKRELFVVKRTKIEAWRDDGIKYLSMYPYTANYKGILQVALGDMNEDGIVEIYVAPSKGYALPIKTYNIFGRQIRDDFYPFGAQYSGGYSLAIGDVDGGLNTELVIGRGGDKTAVYVYDKTFALKYEWMPFESWFLGGAHVAVGNINDDVYDEIVVGRGEGGKPDVAVFDARGSLLGSRFTAFQTFGTPGVDVRVVDVDFDGKDDIVTLSEDGF